MWRRYVSSQYIKPSWIQKEILNLINPSANHKGNNQASQSGTAQILCKEITG